MEQRRRGMTVVELLLVFLIIAILAALLLPARRSAGGAALRTQCKNNQKNIGLALHNFQETGSAAMPVEVCPPDCADFGAEIDMVEFAEHPERFTGPNRPWWYVGDPADLASEATVSL